ncbi:pre-mRNA 3'-end-processing factor FIP1 isoform X2 [Diorhabda carinulata]|uniref:pre-mRNA 3'-end-processing factor FIP1 isoform X2 n=1 Tax=Diorhabda sublineata TaxID=1163346 RepID=UPI0024E11FAE|nr:pre-mRNA 3'-end-processing factor FIP1 isoform X2 [Diorhabda sublineata]XP_057666564.1 pre-mRNA 3'-end-processing factor FIP1 isoform X2 [Diorhabda carinulata]
MADELEDDQWLYGETPDLNIEEASKDPPISEPVETEENGVQEEQQKESEQQEPQTEEAPVADEEVDTNEPEEKEIEEPSQDGMEDGEVQQNGEDSEKDLEDDDSDDDVNVVIGDIKTTAPSYTPLNIKRGGLLTSVSDKTKQIQQPQQQPGKFTVEEFEQIGTINGVLSSEFNLDSLEDKPWKKPGADITDYFNYGFNEDTWRAYCERQKRMRVNESGVGIMSMNMMGAMPRGPVPIMNDNSKYTGNNQRMQQPMNKGDQLPKVNTIQVMTADRREYSRKPGFPDMTVPPPGNFETFQPEYGFNPEPEPFYGGYEPTQDSQWGNEPPPGWAPTELKTLTGPPPMGPPPMHMGPPPGMGVRSPSSRRDGSPHKERDRERESRTRSEKSKDRERDRERERSHRRDRSRSRSRRHRSRSRSPSHRSHRKKKSKRHDDSE